MDQDLKDRFFLAGQESPGAWLLQALQLYSAANRLDEKKNPIGEDEPCVTYLGVYQMLNGLAFENLLKGYISLVRLESGELPALPKECYVHSLENLATRPECTDLALTEEEREVLSRLSPYIEWAGRYPLPKKSTEMIVLYSDSTDREAMRNLWERLVSLLHSRAWVMKGGPVSMGGKKLYLKR